MRSPRLKLNVFWLLNFFGYYIYYYRNPHLQLVNDLQTGESSFPDLELNVAHLRDHDFRVEHGGVSMIVSIAVYQKVKFSPNKHRKQIFFFKISLIYGLFLVCVSF